MSNSTTYKDDIQTSSSFINYLTNLLTIPNIIQFETHVISYEKVLNNFPNITLGNSQKFELLISHFIKVIYDLTEIQDYNYYRPEQETILEFVKNLGSLGFELRIKDEFQVQAYRIHTLAKHILNCKNFNTSFKEHLAHSFLYHYHNKKTALLKNLTTKRYLKLGVAFFLISKTLRK